MTTDELAYYRATLAGQLQRLHRLVGTYAGDLNPMGLRMLSRAAVAVTNDYLAALQQATDGPHNVSSAPPPPAESSPEDYP